MRKPKKEKEKKEDPYRFEVQSGSLYHIERSATYTLTRS